MYKIPATIDNLELSDNLFDTEMLNYTENQLDEYLILLLDQQIGNKNKISFTVEPGDDVLAFITCIICKQHSSIITVQEGEFPSNIKMSKGDLLIFPSELKHQFNKEENLIIKKIYYFKNINQNVFLNNYTVVANMIDKYEIEIWASSEKEAIEIAENTRISKWKHVDLFPEIEERKIIRYSKWGNFEIKPID